MLNKFEKALKKGMKVMKTPAGRLAFRSFLAEACLELDSLPTQEMIDEAWLYAKNVENLLFQEAEEFSETGHRGRFYEPSRFPDDVGHVVREWIDWNGLRK